MSTILNPAPVARRRALGEEWPNGLLVASDGRAPSDAALVAARKLAPQGAFGVLSVLPTTTHLDRPNETPAETMTSDQHTAMIESQIERLFGESADAWVETRLGYPPAVLASYADVHGASLLIVGLGRSRVLDRLLGDESTLRLARLARTPILAVAPQCAVPARRVVMALDLTATSMHAARLALDLAAADADVVAVNVESGEGPADRDAAIKRAAQALQTGFCGRVTSRLLRGDPATELLGLANAWDADLISIGLHGSGPAQRVAIGNVAMRVVRCASCSVIAAPRD